MSLIGIEYKPRILTVTWGELYTGTSSNSFTLIDIYNFIDCDKKLALEYLRTPSMLEVVCLFILREVVTVSVTSLLYRDLELAQFTAGPFSVYHFCFISG